MMNNSDKYGDPREKWVHTNKTAQSIQCLSVYVVSCCFVEAFRQCPNNHFKTTVQRE